MKQEWRAKEKASSPALTTSNDDMDLLDDDESPLIKDGSLPSTGKDGSCCRPSSEVSRGRLLRCVLTPKKMCLRSLKSQTNTRVVVCLGSHRWELVSRMLIDGDTVINLMSYAMFKKFR
jgi:hypothetical protein